MKKSVPLFFLIAFVLCSCKGSSAPNQISLKTNSEPEDFSGGNPVSVANPTKTDLAPILERQTKFEEDVTPVSVSYIETTEQGDQISSYSLSSQRGYGRISVADKTYFRGPAAVDDENNLYLVYGSRENFVSKLSLDGDLQTIQLPFRWRIEIVWAGNKLFILPLSADNSMAVVDTDLNIETVSPAINRLEDGRFARGTLGVPDPTESIAIWVLTQPLTDEAGDYALYRTISLENLEVSEQRLKIPDSYYPRYETDVPTSEMGERSHTLVHGVDLQYENVVLCSIYKGGNTTLELYSSQDEQIIASMEYCCMREEMFDLRGGTIVESRSFPETCGSIQAINLSDLQPSFDIGSYIQPYDPSHHWLARNPSSDWLGSNGNYWLILSDDEVTVINEDRQYEVSYSLPSTLPLGWVPGSTLALAFRIIKK